MNPFACYRLHITPLSPIHIGTGESYQPTNYVIEDGTLHEFDTGAAMGALSGADRETLLRIASGKPNEDMLKALQSFLYERRKPLQAYAINSIPVLPGIAGLYDKRVGKPANHEGDGKQVINRLEIDRTAYNPITRHPVLFGSSLKGAIRTALLDQVNGQRPVRQVEDRRSGRKRKENNQELQQRLLEFSAGKFELDPLRLVQLADAYWQGEEGLPAAQVHLAVNRKKHPVKDEHGNLRKSQAEEAKGGGLYQILECVPEWHYHAFAGQLNLQHLDAINHKAQHSLPAESLHFDIEQIARACHDFYKERMDEENQILRERGFLDSAWDEVVAQTLELAQNKIKQGQAFLLRVGRHSGAESMTLNGVRNIKIMKGNPQDQPEAKTLWLAANEIDQHQNLQPFGWLLVEVEPLEEKPQDWPELRELYEPQLKTARAFAANLESQREAMAKARAEAGQQRREEEEQARQKAQAEAEAARQAAERQAHLATLSEQARQVEAFRERMEREGAQQWAQTGNGGGWFSDLKNLAQSAAAWMPDDKEALLAVLRELGQRDPRLSPKKNDGIKKLIRSLSA